MSHDTKTLIEYVVFGIGVGAGLLICILPFLANDTVLPRNFLFAGKLTPLVGVVIIVATFAWGYLAHQQCKKGVCDLPASPEQRVK